MIENDPELAGFDPLGGESGNKLEIDIVTFAENQSQEVPNIKKMRVVHFTSADCSEKEKVALRFRRENLEVLDAIFLSQHPEHDVSLFWFKKLFPTAEDWGTALCIKCLNPRLKVEALQKAGCTNKSLLEVYSDMGVLSLLWIFYFQCTSWIVQVLARIVHFLEVIMCTCVFYAGIIWFTRRSLSEVAGTWYKVLQSATGAIFKIQQSTAEVLLGVPPLAIQNRINTVKHFLKLVILSSSKDPLKVALQEQLSENT